MTEENLSHEEVFGHLFKELTDETPISVSYVFLYLSNDELFRKFVSYKCKGQLMKMFPPTTLGEVRQWKKENK